jgi:transposase InsO family protein
MPWEEHRVVDVREQFVLRAMSKEGSFVALCREFQISRKTGYKWLARYEHEGVAGLKDRSRRPRLSARVSGEAVLRVLELHARHGWGPKKLHRLLIDEKAADVPSVRTVARILRRSGIAAKKRRRVFEVSASQTRPSRVVAAAPNDVWTLDFKGWWLAGNGERCEPLTVRDAFSRYLLCAEMVESHATETIRRAFERLFREFGLPKALQFDNGEPFAARQARAGLTRLSAWWVSLGIQLVRSRPGKPQDNGGHERMHVDLKCEVQLRPAHSRRAQQRAVSAWRKTFNELRPHEALAMKTPAECYLRSERPYRPPVAPTYSTTWLTRRVSAKGFVRVEGSQLFIGEGLVGHQIGLEPVLEGLRAWFYNVELGIVRAA